MKFLILFTALTFFSNQSLSQETSFDEKPSCIKEGGNWRKFADGCADSCRAKFDIFSFCTQTITFGCDCGENKCLNKGKCIDQKEYGIIYNEYKKEEAKKLEEMRKARLEKFKTDPAYSYQLRNLYPIPTKILGQDSNNKKSQPVVRSVSTGEVIQENPRRQAEPVIRKVPPAYVQRQNKEAINSNGEVQDLAFPVIPLPQK